MRTYCFRSCVSIRHSNDYNRKNAHGHTVEVAVFVRLGEMVSDVKEFGDTEHLIASCLEPYQECYLNELTGFEENVSIEYLGETLFALLDRKLNDSDICMERLEIGETPLRTYIVTRTV